MASPSRSGRGSGEAEAEAEADSRSASRILQYRSMAALERAMETASQEAAAMGEGDARVVFLDVPTHIIEQLCAEGSDHYHQIKYFDIKNHSMELTMPFPAHEIGADVGEKLFERALTRIGMRRAFQSTKSSTIKGAGDGKQPDCSFRWLPEYRPHQAPANVPPIIVEVGTSESARDLLADCRWWFENNPGAIRAAMLIDIDISRKRVEISVHTMGPCPGVISRTGQLTAHIVNEEWAFQDEDEAPMIIPFVTLFRRDPDASVGEQDLVISRSDFEEVAYGLIAELDNEADASSGVESNQEFGPSINPDEERRIEDLPKPRRRH